MPEAGADLWVSQAESDRHAAKRVYDPNDERTLCQAIAKCRQVVEKSIKAIAAGLRDANIERVPEQHYYRHNVNALISVLRRPLRPNDDRDIQSRINQLLNEHNRREINALSLLAPKGRPGLMNVRNTEYPYECQRGVWTAPARQGAFMSREVDRFTVLAERIYGGARAVVTSLRRK